MNKLENILQEFDDLLYGELQIYNVPESTIEPMRKFVKEKLVEYARSVVPSLRGKVDASISKLAHDRAHGFDKCIECIHEQIDQDFQSLTQEK